MSGLAGGPREAPTCRSAAAAHSLPPHSAAHSPPPARSLVVPNRRQDVQFALVRGGVIQAVSPVVTNAAPNLPGGVKAVPEKTPAAFTVQWQTLNASQPRVLWGTSPSALSSAANATTTTYTKADLVSACTQGVLTTPLSGMTAALQGWTTPGSIHKALLSGLQPDTTYYYQARGRRRGLLLCPLACHGDAAGSARP